MRGGAPVCGDYNQRMISFTNRGAGRLLGTVLVWAIQMFFSPAATAASTERFAQFIGATQSARAVFEQKVFDRSGKLVQES